MRYDPEELKPIVGKNTYAVWIDMLSELVPDSPTHRLAPMIAGMLQYAANMVEEKYGDDLEEDSVAFLLVNPPDYFDPEEGHELLGVIQQLFDDAGVEYQRYSSRGEGYSIAEEAAYEFIHWYDMPWEA